MSHTHTTRRWAVALAALAVGTLVGCSSEHATAAVSGSVTVTGKNAGPLPGGNITFVLVSNPTVVGGGTIKSDGTFEVLNAPVGECKVVIDNTNLELKTSAAPGMGPGNMPGMVGAPKSPVGGGGGGPPKDARDKMSKPPGGPETSGDMSAGKDTGTPKYVPIDPQTTKADSTTLRHTVPGGGGKGVTFEVKGTGK